MYCLQYESTPSPQAATEHVKPLASRFMNEQQAESCDRQAIRERPTLSSVKSKNKSTYALRSLRSTTYG
jgi:hypothetical protein